MRRKELEEEIGGRALGWHARRLGVIPSDIKQKGTPGKAGTGVLAVTVPIALRGKGN